MTMSIYFGPYIHCKIEQMEVVINIRCCPNMDCENKNLEIHAIAHNFCAKCGKEIKLKGVPVIVDKITKEATTLLNANDTMCLLQPEGGVHLWLSNMTDMSYYLGVTGADYEIKDVQNIDYTFHINRFMEYYKNAINELDKFYGQTNCTTRFSLLIWDE